MFSFFSLISLKIWQFCWSVQRGKFLYCCLFLLVSYSPFLYFLSFITYFFLHTLGLVCSFFLFFFLKWKNRLLFYIFFDISMHNYKFPPSTALAATFKFCYFIFSFLLFHTTLFSFVFSLWPTGYLEVYCLITTDLWVT